MAPTSILKLAASAGETACAVVLTFDVPALADAYRFAGQFRCAPGDGEEVRRLYPICSGV
jgi:hypothetical protein